MGEPKIKLAVLLDAYSLGGSAKVVVQNLKFLPPTIAAFVILFRRGAETALEAELKARNIEFKVVQESFAFDPLVIPKIVSILKSESVNLIESNHYKTHLLALIVAKLLRIPWVSVSHGWTSENWKVRLYNFIDRISLPFSSACVAMGPSIGQKLKLMLPKYQRPRVIPTAFDPSEIVELPDTLSSKLSIQKSDFIFAAVGRLSYEKGFDLLLSACELLSSQHKNFKLFLVGDGPEKEALIKKIQESGLSPFVVLLGPLKSQEVQQLYQLIDCLVIPSRSEGMPNVLLEAAWFEVPVIASRVGGIPAFMADELYNWTYAEDSRLPKLMFDIVLRNKVQRKEIGQKLKDRLACGYLAKDRVRKIARLYRAVVSNA